MFLKCSNKYLYNFKKLRFSIKMEGTSTSVQQRRELFPEITPTQSGFLQVSNIHKIYWEEYGNPQGLPAIIIHGGPGGGSSPAYPRTFDPVAYRIIQFDQRGAGKSEPHACLEENTTWDLVSDIEVIRKDCNVEKWHTVFGGSWGSTLSLAYAESHPERVGHLVLRGIFLLRRSEIQFFYQEGSSWLFPEYHEQLRNLLPEVERDDILGGYYRRVSGSNEEERIKFAKMWTKWEMATSKLYINEDLINKGEDDKFALAFARIETHYFINGGFLRKNNQLLEDSDRIKYIPTEIVQGRYDVVCPAKSAYDLSKRLDNVSLRMIPDAGHSFSEPGIIDALVKATERFKANKL
jgi:proline iminopeptidase